MADGAADRAISGPPTDHGQLAAVIALFDALQGYVLGDTVDLGGDLRDDVIVSLA